MYIENPIQLQYPKTTNPECIELENPFADSDDKNSILILVEDTKLYVNGDILKTFSLVFCAMLSEKFVEGQQRKIELPGKKAQDIIMLLRFFYPTMEIFFTIDFDFYPLLSLCEEYQLDWLKKKIIHYIIAWFNAMCVKGVEKNIEGDVIIYLLYLAEQFNFNELKERCHNYKLKATIKVIADVENLKLLSKESKISIYKYYLKEKMLANDNCSGSSSYVFTSSGFTTSYARNRDSVVSNCELINLIHTFTD